MGTALRSLRRRYATCYAESLAEGLAEEGTGVRATNAILWYLDGRVRVSNLDVFYNFFGEILDQALR